MGLSPNVTLGIHANPTDKNELAAAARPSYVDQLGMYCTMTGRDQGRLFVYKRALYGRPGALKGFDVRFKDLTAVEREMVRRRALFREGLASQDPSRLPRCEWFELRGDYRAVCGCAAAEPLGRVVPAAAVQIAENPELVTAMTALLTDAPRPGPQFRLNDLVFPRRAAIERQAVAEAKPEEEEADLDTALAGMERLRFAEALKDALWDGVARPVAPVPPSPPLPHGEP